MGKTYETEEYAKHVKIIEAYAAIYRLFDEDSLAEGFATYAYALRKYREGGAASFTTYLISALKHAYARRRRRLWLEAKRNERSTVEPLTFDDDNNFEELIEPLSPENRILARWRWRDDFTFDEIGRHMGWTKAQTRHRFVKIVEELRSAHESEQG
jgi:DNA-directed RNA polymerase specialized sigma24 family protein